MNCRWEHKGAACVCLSSITSVLKMAGFWKKLLSPRWQSWQSISLKYHWCAIFKKTASCRKTSSWCLAKSDLCGSVRCLITIRYCFLFQNFIFSFLYPFIDEAWRLRWNTSNDNSPFANASQTVYSFRMFIQRISQHEEGGGRPSCCKTVFLGPSLQLYRLLWLLVMHLVCFLRVVDKHG